MTVSVIVGGAFGDEGKGKITGVLAKKRKIKAAVRAGVGSNAGHTVVYNGKTYKLRLISSGFVEENASIYIGAGVLINPEIFLDEIKRTGIENRVFIDKHSGVITSDHITRETNDNHLMTTVGSTGSGCGEANVDRVRRILKLAKEYPELEKYIVDVSEEINDLIDDGADVIIEGSQATFLSLYHGTYPYVTSKDVSAAAAISDVGIGPTRVDEVIVVFKSFFTRVGKGYLDGELSPEEVKARGWEEYGTVTNRLRRAAPFNYELARKAVRINGATSIALTKVDILFPEVAGVTKYDELSKDAIDFIKSIEDKTNVKVKYISTGPETRSIIFNE